jgi:hypothetical protein
VLEEVRCPQLGLRLCVCAGAGGGALSPAVHHGSGRLPQ